MTVAEDFDAVVMLTWSDWKTESRSNRYHYATRFARQCPVFFVQPWALPDSPIRVESSGVDNIDIVHLPSIVGKSESMQLRRLLVARGVKSPLIWIYNSLHFQALIDDFVAEFKVYHATEDYFTDSDGLAISDTKPIRDSICRLLPRLDLLVAVSDGVLASYLAHTPYVRDSVVVSNGCDARFYARFAENATSSPACTSQRKVAIFQGGLNVRLDYQLLLAVAELLPGWDFRFCGPCIHSEGLERLLERPNVRYLGNLNPEQVAREMVDSHVGIIPFMQDQWIRNSLPLKAYEYVACGLPVVTVPIDALFSEPTLFFFATDSAGFASQMERAYEVRYESVLLTSRQLAAEKNSYDSRFADALSSISQSRRKLKLTPRRFNVALLFDPWSTFVGTVREHLDAFRKYSDHDVSFVPCTNKYANPSDAGVFFPVDLSIFDVVIVHYSVRLSVSNHLAECFFGALRAFSGLKVLFIQDEYEETERSRKCMDDIQFDIVYTCVPESCVEQVYPKYRFPATDFLPTLTGYVPESGNIERLALPLRERQVMIGYRGRRLPFIYGRLGHEKYQIGLVVKAEAERRGLPVDIEVDDASRIYGDGWYRFLGSVRATLGTESGANVFDFDGTLKKRISALEARHPEASFEYVFEHVLDGHEGRVRMNQISPKIFEAIQLRTALVLFEGEYSGVVETERHYIPLKKDFSNIDEVFDKLRDDSLVEAMTGRAYDEVIGSGQYSYSRFVKSVDADIGDRLLHPKRRKCLVGAVFSVEEDGRLTPVLPAHPLGLSAGASPLDCNISIDDLSRLSGQAFASVVPCSDVAVMDPARHIVYRLLRAAWQMCPAVFKRQALAVSRSILKRNDSDATRSGLVFAMSRRLWHVLPRTVRVRLARLIERN